MVWCDLRSIDAAASKPSRVLAAAFVTVRAASCKKMGPQHRPTRGAAHQNHHSRSFAPAAIRSSVGTMYHDPITKYWSVSGYRTRRTRPCSSVVRVQQGECCSGRHSTDVCALVNPVLVLRATSLVSNASSFVRLRGRRGVDAKYPDTD